MSAPIRSIDTAQLLTTKAIANSSVETQLLVSPLVTVPDGATQLVILVSAVLFANQASTGFSVHLRRGSGLTGLTLQPDPYAINLPAVNARWPFGMQWMDQITTIGTVQYTLSAAYSGNDSSCTCTYAGMILLVV